MYTIQALWTAAHQAIGAKFVILQQRRLSAAEAQHPAVLEGQGLAGERVPGLVRPDATRTSASTGSPQSMGVAAVRVETPGPDRAGARAGAVPTTGPFLIDLVVSNEVEHDVEREKHLPAADAAHRWMAADDTTHQR